MMRQNSVGRMGTDSEDISFYLKEGGPVIWKEKQYFPNVE